MIPKKRKLKETYLEYLRKKEIRNPILLMMDISDDTLRRWIREKSDQLENINILNFLWINLPEEIRPANLYGLLEPEKRDRNDA